MAEVSQKKWYVVRAVSGQEAKIKDYIASEISRLGYDSFLEDILVLLKKWCKSVTEKKYSKKKYISQVIS